MALLKIKVVPGAATTQISGWMQDTLKVRVHAPAEKGKANSALLGFLCERLDLSPAHVRIRQGQHSPRKTLEVDGLSEEEIRSRLAE